MSLPFLNTAPDYDEELRNSVFFERGLHATSTCGAVGAAVAVATLQGQDEAGIASAAGIAASMGAGLLEANRTGGTVKRVHCGWAAPAAWQRPTWPRHGLTGPPTVLEGRFGFLQAFCGDRAHPDAAVRGLGTDWELPRVVFKPYPCNHFTHAGVDAALRLRAQGLAPADVTAIELGVAKPVLRTIAEPPEAKARPASGYHAAFSGPHMVAASLPRVVPARLPRRPARDHPHGRGTRGPRRGQPRRPRQPPVRRGAGEEVPRQRREVPPGGARGRARGPNARPS